MGKRGPAPQPTVLKLMRGNPGKRPLNKNEPKPRPVSNSLKYPDWFDEIARREWKRIVPELRQLGLLTVIDISALEAYCATYSRWVRAEKIVKKEGETYRAEGEIKRRPEVGIIEKALHLMKTFCTEFGLTPSSRSNISISKPDENSFEF